MSRFASMIAIMNLTTQTYKTDCSVSGNKLCTQVLSLLRQKGLIAGYCLDFQRPDATNSFFDGYPRYKIFFKYHVSRVPVIKHLRLCTNRAYIQTNKTSPSRLANYLTNYDLIVISTNKGLQLVSQQHGVRVHGSIILYIKI